ncbi:MAG: HlyD protein [Pseudomonadota bacterium]|nr:HlyD protein [Pseudomonadota bacterium]
MHLSPPARKTLIFCLGFSLLLLVFYISKQMFIHFFIQKFTQQKPYVHAIHPTKTQFTKFYHTIGECRAVQIVDLSPPVAGHVQSIHFKANQHVQKGQLLIQLEDAFEVAQKKLQWTEYQLQKKLHTQYTALYEHQNLSKTQFLESKARFEKAHAAYDEALAQWQHKKILAPFSGIIGIPNIYQGLYISPGQKDLVRIVQLKPLFLDFDIPEKYYTKLNLGDRIQIAGRHHANIIAIEPLSQQIAHTVHVRAKIAHSQGHFIPGQFVKIKVPVLTSKTLLSIPSSALLASPSGMQVLTAVYNGKQRTYQVMAKKIRIFQNFKTNTLITSGIGPNDWVIDAGTQKISDGQAIHLRKA